MRIRSGAMPPARKRPSSSRQQPTPASRATKKATNLTLDPEAIANGERFGRLHGTSLSQLVNRLLLALPGAMEVEPTLRTPAVRRLYGAAAGAAASRDDYREHLASKYGDREG